MMRLPFESLWQTNYVLVPLKPSDSAGVASLHVDVFHRPWSDGEFRALLSESNVFGFLAKAEGKPHAAPTGFILLRMAAGEAEILTLAVAKSMRRHGLGRRLVDESLRRLHALRVGTLFLEVDGANKPAITLYKRLGFKKVGERPAYYDGPGGKTPALVMRLDLG
jgi:[ribosomal protein S18]-alanine N-acetyltransferase